MPVRAERLEIPCLDLETESGKERSPSLCQLPANAQRLTDIPIGGNTSPTLLLDIYLPANHDKPLPLIVWVHGGGWHSTAGSRQEFAPGRVVGRGYALAAITYRSSQVVKFPAQIEDCKEAIRYLRSNAGKYGYDPDRIGVWGISAGGHLAALLGMTGGQKDFEGPGGVSGVSTRVQAACDFCGPTDFFQTGGDPETSAAFSRVRPAFENLLGGDVEDHRELAIRANPITYARSDVPPMLIMHGDADPLVPACQSDILYEALRDKGAEVQYCVVRNGGHLFVGPEVDRIVDEFFDRHLRGNESKKQK